MDEATKFAWAYLITHGKLTNGNWSYYGGCWEDIDGGVSFEQKISTQAEIEDGAVSVGIDWEKTGVPEVSTENVFNGTFESGGYCLGTIGTLFLKNGKSYRIGSDDEDAAHLAKTAREMMKGRSGIQELSDKL